MRVKQRFGGRTISGQRSNGLRLECKPRRSRVWLACAKRLRLIELGFASILDAQSEFLLITKTSLAPVPFSPLVGQEGVSASAKVQHQ